MFILELKSRSPVFFSFFLNSSNAEYIVYFNICWRSSYIDYNCFTFNCQFRTIEYRSKFVVFFSFSKDYLSWNSPVAIPYNTISKKLSRNVQSAGLHLNAPGFRFITFPSVFTSMEFDDISVWYFEEIKSRRLSICSSVSIEMAFR